MVLLHYAMPKPCKRHARGFAEAGGNANQPISACLVSSQPGLPVVTEEASRALKQIIECHAPPFAQARANSQSAMTAVLPNPVGMSSDRSRRLAPSVDGS